VLEIRGIGIHDVVVDLVISIETRGPGVSCEYLGGVFVAGWD
jgi:hypothetical protein